MRNFTTAWWQRLLLLYWLCSLSHLNRLTLQKSNNFTGFLNVSQLCYQFNLIQYKICTMNWHFYTFYWEICNRTLSHFLLYSKIFFCNSSWQRNCKYYWYLLSSKEVACKNMHIDFFFSTKSSMYDRREKCKVGNWV